MKKTEFTSLGQILPLTVRRYNLERQVSGAVACHRFREAISVLWGVGITEHVRPVYYREGVLAVAVVNSSWAQAVQLKRVALMEAVTQPFNDLPVRELRIKVEPFSA